jgi:3-hydroxybutyryl-CoA dehydrogenase
MSVSTIGVIGAGVMGSGIAQVAATKGIDVILLDVSEKAVKTGIDAVERRLSAVVTKGKITPAEKDAALRRIKGTTGYDSLEPADVIIEAATEDYDLKIRIFKQLDALVNAEAIIASNTSSVSITKLASSISHPERVVGLHFFNPCRSCRSSRSCAGWRPAMRPMTQLWRLRGSSASRPSPSKARRASSSIAFCCR